MKKRILSLLLAAIILLSLVPMAVSASGNVTLSGTLSADTGYDNGTGDFFYISNDVIYNSQTVTVQIAIKNTQNGIGTFDSNDIDLNNSEILVGFTYIWFEEVKTSFVGNANGLTGSMVGKDGNTYVISLQKSTSGSTVYTVAGNSDLMGSEWDPTDNANNMTDMGDGSFQLVKENVVLSAGDYMYKVVSDHTWGTGDYPQDDNKTLTIAEDGTYTVTFTLLPANADLSATADKFYRYTEYTNWQIKYGNTWEWSGDMEKVEEGLFKLEILWQGTGINVKSDANPIKKDWFALEELTIGEEVIAPVNVDVYLRVIDDKTLKIGVGVVPEDSTPTHTHNPVKINGQAATETAAGFKDYYECKDSTDACHKYFEDAAAKVEITDLNAWKAQGGAGYIPKLEDKKIITEISLSLTEYTRDNISFTSIPYPEAKITGITEGNEDVELETGYIYFFDKDGKWIYSCLLSGPEAKPVWYDMSSYKAGEDGMEGEKVIDTAPDYSRIKKAIVNVMATSKNGFAPELKVTVNGKALGVSKMVEGTYNAETMAGYQVMEQDAYFFVPFDIADSTTSPKTGDTSNMALWVMLLALSSTGLCACLVLGKKRKTEQ